MDKGRSSGGGGSRSIPWLDFPPRALFRPRFLIILACTALAEPLFRLIDWGWLQHVFRDTVVTLLRWHTDLVGASGSIGYSFRGIEYEMRPRCTYTDLLCLTTPLLLRNRGWRGELVVLAGWWLLVLSASCLRVVAAHLVGAPWFWSHDLVDYLARSVIMLLVILSWLSHVAEGRQGQDGPARPTVHSATGGDGEGGPDPAEEKPLAITGP